MVGPFKGMTMGLPTPEELRASLQHEAESEKEELPPITHIELDCVDSRGHRYRGTFIFKVPTIGDQIEIGQMKARYLPQGSAADANAALLNEMVCFLEVTLQKPRPEWWKPFELYDSLPVTRVYAEALKYERRFLGRGQVDGSNEGVSSGDTENGESPAEEAAPGAGTSSRAFAKRRTIASSDRPGGD